MTCLLGNGTHGRRAIISFEFLITGHKTNNFTYSKPEVQCGAWLQDTRAGKACPKVSDLYRGGRKCPDKVYASKE